MYARVGGEGNRAMFLKFDLKIKNEMKISFGKLGIKWNYM